MSKVYSAKLATYFSPFGGGSHTVSVPDGHVWVVRSVFAQMQSTDYKHTQSGWSVSQNGANFIAGVQAPYALAGFPFHLDTRQVLDPGDELVIEAGDTGWSIYVSGYDLILP